MPKTPVIIEAVRDPARWAPAYRRYRPLLFGTLGRLARRGYPVPPDEGLDLVHDFFVEAWAKVEIGYDPTRASFEAYLSGYFLNFARPRIIRLSRARSSLMDPRDIARLAQYASESTDVAATDLAAVAKALSVLGAPHRAMLEGYLSEPRVSERNLALRFSLSRYELRLRLADAVGEVAARVGGTNILPEPDRSVSDALWGGGRSIRQTAVFLHLSVAEVQSARRRMFERLVRAVKGDRKPMVHFTPGVGTERAARDLLLAALRDDDQALNAIPDRAGEIWEYLAGPDAEAMLSEDLAIDPQRLAAVYSALSNGDVVEQRDGMEPYLSEGITEEELVGSAFGQALLPSLPHELADIVDVFRNAPRVDPEHARYLSEEPSMRDAELAPLADFGLTPVVIAGAARAVSNLAADMHRRAAPHSDGQVLIDGRDPGSAGRSDVDAAAMGPVRVVELATRLPTETAAILFGWLVRVAAFVPQLFDGFEANVDGDVLHLRKVAEVNLDLFERWKAVDGHPFAP